MNVNSVNGQTQGIMNMNQKQDAYEKNIQWQIASLQEEMEPYLQIRRKQQTRRKMKNRKFKIRYRH